MTFSRPSVWDDHSWRDDAACRNIDPVLFFPVGTAGDAAEETRAAIALCRRCPVSEQCLEFAMVTNQRDGIWGATSEDDRRRMRSAWVAARRLREPEGRRPASTTHVGMEVHVPSVTSAAEAR